MIVNEFSVSCFSYVHSSARHNVQRIVWRFYGNAKCICKLFRKIIIIAVLNYQNDDCLKIASARTRTVISRCSKAAKIYRGQAAQAFRLFSGMTWILALAQSSALAGVLLNTTTCHVYYTIFFISFQAAFLQQRQILRLRFAILAPCRA